MNKYICPRCKAVFGKPISHLNSITKKHCRSCRIDMELMALTKHMQLKETKYYQMQWFVGNVHGN